MSALCRCAPKRLVVPRGVTKFGARCSKAIETQVQMHTMSQRRCAAVATQIIAPKCAHDTAVSSFPTETHHQVIKCDSVNDGRQVDVEFSNGDRYQLHTAWLRDSGPALRGPDFYRLSAVHVWELDDFKIKSGSATCGGEEVEVIFEARGKEIKETYNSRWLRSFCPYVGRPLTATAAKVAPIKGSGSLLASRLSSRRAWKKEVDAPTFEAKVLSEDTDTQAEFLLRTLVDQGFAVIHGVGRPNSLEREYAGKPLVELGFAVIGTHLNQHPVWSLKYDILQESAVDGPKDILMQTANADDPSAGYLKWMYQASGSVRTKLCDGIALAEHIKKHHPRAYDILTTLDVTHTSRTQSPNLDGVPSKSVHHHPLVPVPFELVNTQPIIKLDKNGFLERAVMSDEKRAMSDLPFEMFEQHLEAYEIWSELCQNEQFHKEVEIPEGSVLVINAWRLLQGHSTLPSGNSRVMCWGYSNKTLVENRYRLLRQYQTERSIPRLSSVWSTRVPNQVLENILV